MQTCYTTMAGFYLVGVLVHDLGEHTSQIGSPATMSKGIKVKHSLARNSYPCTDRLGSVSCSSLLAPRKWLDKDIFCSYSTTRSGVTLTRLPAVCDYGLCRHYDLVNLHLYPFVVQACQLLLDESYRSNWRDLYRLQHPDSKFIRSWRSHALR